jgi:hypothetical protein
MCATRSPASIRTPPSQGRTCTVGASWDATSASKHDEEHDEAWKRIKTAAKKYGVEVNEESWRELGKGKGHSK